MTGVGVSRAERGRAGFLMDRLKEVLTGVPGSELAASSEMQFEARFACAPRPRRGPFRLPLAQAPYYDSKCGIAPGS